MIVENLKLMVDMKVKEGQTLFDISLQELGSIEGVFELAMLNGFNMTDDLVPGQKLKLPEVIEYDIQQYYKNKSINPATLLTYQAQLISSEVDTIIRNIDVIQSNSIPALQGQSLFDIALQTTGSVEAAFDMALLNLIAITDDIEAGRELIKVSVINNQITSYYSDKNIKPATFIQGSIGDDIGGIEYWAIETEFLVS